MGRDFASTLSQAVNDLPKVKQSRWPSLWDEEGCAITLSICRPFESHHLASLRDAENSFLRMQALKHLPKVKKSRWASLRDEDDRNLYPPYFWHIPGIFPGCLRLLTLNTLSENDIGRRLNIRRPSCLSCCCGLCDMRDCAPHESDPLFPY